MDRYQRQSIFRRIGQEGQAKLAQARVAIVGIGALGTVIANELVRAGVGFLRLIDRDCVEYHNLHRQMLFTENDALLQIPKAVAARQHLVQVNSTIEIEAIVADFNGLNAISLTESIDLVLDGTDNRETRLLIDEVCFFRQIPWVFGGVLGSSGMTMNIIPGKSACYHCLIGAPKNHFDGNTCSTSGVLNMITGIVASLQSVEALKILLQDPDLRTDLLFWDIWNNQHLTMAVEPRPDCPLCQQKKYYRLNHATGVLTQLLCGQDAVQIIPGSSKAVNFTEIAERLKSICTVNYNTFMLTLDDGEHPITLFRDGRAIIRKVRNEGQALGIYTDYFGL
jgi:adenylyltransferase/sulfurtransferase